MANEPNSVIDPKEKSNANFCGETGSNGKYENDIDTRNIPSKKTPPNWASLAGETTMARKPETPLVTLPAPVAATALADPAAFPATLPALSLTVLALSLASTAAFLLDSEIADVA
eukprot:CAMPEP_0172812250 /NCGR_PEP_ID=MMETSP1075-20121228/9926_1 /TAXON_ID=2916 /ORGANISM="Ceratium fusus, Strain PA161109" /LENGTH=114 /DNA_ID=CAMNT_0013651781 /DNA_START=222 /DNA_END=566 /DNA_ORIENTATION=-